MAWRGSRRRSGRLGGAALLSGWRGATERLSRGPDAPWPSPASDARRRLPRNHQHVERPPARPSLLHLASSHGDTRGRH
jgi:hypothetical protein